MPSPSPLSVRVGLDENGLGPRLGPLLVTAITAETCGSGDARAEARPRGALRERLGDSKQLVSHGHTALGEAWARAIARRTGPGDVATPGALLDALSLDSAADLRAPCPRGHEAQCWSAEGEVFVAGPELVGAVERDLDRLEKGGVRIARAAFVVTCAHRLNVAAARGLSRFHVDLHAMERLILQARDLADRDVVATCGKVGGFDRYSPAFGPLGGRLHAVVEEGRARSEYAFPGVGRVRFVRDADARHLLVGMASLVGKWARDLLMARVVRYHRAEDPGLPDASGYHDPVTARFVEATRLTRRARGLPETCFERARAAPGGGAA